MCHFCSLSYHLCCVLSTARVRYFSGMMNVWKVKKQCNESMFFFFLQEEVIPCCPHVCSPESSHLFTIGLSHIRFRHWDCYWQHCKYIQTTVWSTQLKWTHRILSYYLFYNYQVGCAFVAALLHYLFLAAFCWMLCEGVMLYLMLVAVFSKLSKRWWFFLILGWGEL